MSRVVSILVFVFLLAITANARDESIPGSPYSSARGMALGDGDVALTDDGPSGLYNNPAGISRVRGPRVEPINLTLSAGSGLFASGTNLYKFPSLSSFAPELTGSPETTCSGGLSFAPSFSTRGLALGALLQNSFIARGNSDGTITYKSQYEFIPAAGIALKAAGGAIRMGYSLQWVNRTAGQVSTAAGTDLATIGWNQGLAQGSGFRHTAGVALTVPVSYLPSVTVVARNILGTKYGTFTLLKMANNPTGAPPTEDMTFDAGFSISPRMARGNIINFAVAYRDALSTTPFPWYGKLAVGLEFNFTERFYMRVGWGSGYPAAGIALRGKTGEFGVTWSSDELGNSYHSWKNTRFAMQYQIRAF